MLLPRSVFERAHGERILKSYGAAGTSASRATKQNLGRWARGFRTQKFLSVSEVIVHAEEQMTRVQSVVHAGDRVGAACEIHVKIFDLRRPILRESLLQGGARRPGEKGFFFCT